jgi:hypothetical protein
MEATLSGFSFLILFNALNEYMLNSSAPQKSTRRGSCWGEFDRCRLDDPQLQLVGTLLLTTEDARRVIRNTIFTINIIRVMVDELDRVVDRLETRFGRCT